MGYLSPRQRETLDAAERWGPPKLSTGTPADWATIAIAAAHRAARTTKPRRPLAELLADGINPFDRAPADIPPPLPRHQDESP